MSNLKEIRTKIGSVKNTQKITKAMEMVAASKMRRTQRRMSENRPYADKIRTAIGHLYRRTPSTGTRISKRARSSASVSS